MDRFGLLFPFQTTGSDFGQTAATAQSPFVIPLWNGSDQKIPIQRQILS